MTVEQKVKFIVSEIEQAMSFLPRKTASTENGCIMYYRTPQMDVSIEVDETAEVAVLIERDGKTEIFDISNANEFDFTQLFKGKQP